ncbi:GbsR/MarR family transcriptional regulator [Algoriphagus sp. A40]|uniref:GbsR/MarR family transcriptional regulator n=1 Tax=Algoriphagus sp. A40 TaxID=1945863 RepID=UPI0020C4E4F0|nr:MarR family transcriptional regulator [Algoriphagus sp. A40]
MLTEKQKELIERIGVFHEHKGMQPLVGRIIGLLLVHKEAEATFEEVVEMLGVSKSAVSNALTFLQAKDRITYYTKPGDRKRYFRLQMKNWSEDLEKEMLEITKMKEFIDDVIKVREGSTCTEFKTCLVEFSSFLDFFKKEIPTLFKNFRGQKA